MSAATDNAATLKKLRITMRSQRAGLSQAIQEAHADAVYQHLIACGLLLSGRTFAAYESVRGELDPAPVVDHLLATRRQVALPVIDTGSRMDFYRITRGTQFRRNSFGILEPDPLRARFQPSLALDVVFAPLVAFDSAGHRLGMGGGYYDRYLSPHASLPRRPLLIGLAHSLQEVAGLPTAAWDVPLDMVVTERGAVGFSKRALRFTSS